MVAKNSTSKAKTWVKLKNPKTSDDNSAKAYCSFIKMFLWRTHDGQDELLVVMNYSNDKVRRYKYTGVPHSVFEDMWDRAHNPSQYSKEFGSWFSYNIRNNYEYDRFE